MIGRHDLSSVEGQSHRGRRGACRSSSKLTDPVRRSEYAHLVADLAGVTESSVVQSMDAHAPRAGRPQVVVESPKRMSARDKVEREMLKLIARDPAALNEYGPTSSPTSTSTRPSARRAAWRRCATPGATWPRSRAVTTRSSAPYVSSLAVEPLDGDGSTEYAESVWARLQEFVLKTKSDALRMELQKLNPTTDPDYDELFNELVQVDGELRRLRQARRRAPV